MQKKIRVGHQIKKSHSENFDTFSHKDVGLQKWFFSLPINLNIYNHLVFEMSKKQQL